MRFAFSPEQLEFQRVVNDLLKKECPPAVVRGAWTNKSGRSNGVWAKLAEQGVTGLTIPEAHGGLSMNELDAVLLCEAVGRAALPEPFVETVLVVAPAIAASGNAELQKTWLPKLASGEVVAAFAGDTEKFTLGANEAGVFLFKKKETLYVCAREHVQLSRLQQSVDRSRRLYRVKWSAEKAAVIAETEQAELAFQRAVLGTAAVLLGLSGAMLDMTVDYVKTRKQFGAPVGSFQAIKHHLADALIKLEFAKPMVYRAAYSLANKVEDRNVHVSMAKHYAGEAAEFISKVALQCHGAIGYTTEYDLHMWLKRAWALEKAYGDAAWHRERVARRILDNKKF